MQPSVRETTARASRPAGVTPYDFRRPTKLSREHLRMLQMSYDTFARRATTLLTSALRQVCQVTHTDIVQQSYEEYVAGLPQQTLMAMLDVPPLPGTGIFEFSLPTALASIDHLLGGPGGPQQLRTLTDVELVLIKGLLDQILGNLQYAFELLLGMKPALNDIEYNPAFAQAAGATDAVVVAEFDMVIGSEQCRATLCLPLTPMLPRLAMHRARGEDAVDAGMVGTSAVRRLKDRLGNVPLEVGVRFSPTTLSTQQILNLAVGDIVPLRHKLGAPLTIEAAGETFAHAIAGRTGPHLAALIVQQSATNQERSS